jgi:hypothetical protein
VAALIKNLSPNEQDNLMKYIYKAMQNPDEGAQGTSTCGVLLTWHERVRSTLPAYRFTPRATCLSASCLLPSSNPH